MSEHQNGSKTIFGLSTLPFLPNKTLVSLYRYLELLENIPHAAQRRHCQRQRNGGGSGGAAAAVAVQWPQCSGSGGGGSSGGSGSASAAQQRRKQRRQLRRQGQRRRQQHGQGQRQWQRRKWGRQGKRKSGGVGSSGSGMVIGQYNNQPTETEYLDGRRLLQTEQVDLFPSPRRYQPTCTLTSGAIGQSLGWVAA